MSESNKCYNCQERLIPKTVKIKKPDSLCYAQGCQERNTLGTKYCKNCMPSTWKARSDDEFYIYVTEYVCPKKC